jgi:hypothetical protein
LIPISQLRDLGVMTFGGGGPETDKKKIPEQYLLGPLDVRLKVLAGMMDSDGCLVKDPAEAGGGPGVHFVFSQSKL